MQLQDGQIVIKPVKNKLRDGWFGSAITSSETVLDQEMAEATEWNAASIADDSEWVW
jgi:hypothetical protein